jgi:hypothetical protein
MKSTQFSIWSLALRLTEIKRRSRVRVRVTCCSQLPRMASDLTTTQNLAFSPPVSDDTAHTVSRLNLFLSPASGARLVLTQYQIGRTRSYTPGPRVFPLGYTLNHETSSNNCDPIVHVIFRICGGLGGLEASGHERMPYANEDLKRGRREATDVGSFCNQGAGEYCDVQLSRLRDDRHQQVLGHHSRQRVPGLASEKGGKETVSRMIGPTLLLGTHAALLGPSPFRRFQQSTCWCVLRPFWNTNTRPTLTESS